MICTTNTIVSSISCTWRRRRRLCQPFERLLAWNLVLSQLFQLSLILLERFLLIFGNDGIDVGAAVTGRHIPRCAHVKLSVEFTESASVGSKSRWYASSSIIGRGEGEGDCGRRTREIANQLASPPGSPRLRTTRGLQRQAPSSECASHSASATSRHIDYTYG